MKKLTENKLRQIISEELSKLVEIGVDRGFLNGLADALEDMTGKDAYVDDETSESEDVVKFDTGSEILEIIFRSGGARGGSAKQPSVQIYNLRGSVLSGFSVPNQPKDAAKRVIEEFKKLNKL